MEARGFTPRRTSVMLEEQLTQSRWLVRGGVRVPQHVHWKGVSFDGSVGLPQGCHEIRALSVSSASLRAGGHVLAQLETRFEFEPMNVRCSHDETAEHAPPASHWLMGDRPVRNPGRVQFAGKRATQRHQQRAKCRVAHSSAASHEHHDGFLRGFGHSGCCNFTRRRREHAHERQHDQRTR